MTTPTNTARPVSSLIFNPLRNEVTLSYHVDDGNGIELVERVFRGAPGRYLWEQSALGEWKQVCDGLRGMGPTVWIGDNENLKDVVHREFKAMKRADSKSPYPRLVRVSGRPKSVGGKKTVVYLDPESLAMAEKLGGGNVSDGIRQALTLAAQHQELNPEP